MMPVSYTHLDVYKRQVQGHVDDTAKCIAMKDADCSTYFTFEYELNKEMARKGYFTVDKGSVTAVSYTHLNYAWERDEISALIQDIYDSMVIDKPIYYIGTLVTFKRDENVFEVIDLSLIHI